MANNPGEPLDMDAMFDKALDELMEEKKRRAKENPGGAGNTERATPDRLSIEELEKELSQHPFFLKEMPKEGEPLPPILEAFQQLKYAPESNTRAELLENYKQDGLFHFKLKKWRTATMCFSEALKYADDSWEKAKLHNNISACQYQLENYGSSLRDSEKALKCDKKYTKALMRAVNCCAKLNKWDQLIKLHKEYSKGLTDATKDQKIELERLYLQAVRNSKFEAVQQRKSVHVRQLQDESDENILKAIAKRGIRMSSNKFLKRDRETNSDYRVQLTTNGELIWPVLIFYPHIAESDLIQEFYEGATFQEELVQLLEIEKPAWDTDGEFILDNINVYFTNMDTGKYCRIDLLSKLGDVLKHKRYILPENGVPSFMVMAKGNPMCEMILSRMEEEDYSWTGTSQSS